MAVTEMALSKRSIKTKNQIKTSLRKKLNSKEKKISNIETKYKEVLGIQEVTKYKRFSRYQNSGENA
jgi:hypothetical protein